MQRVLVVLLICVLIPIAAGAAEFQEYAQFRYSSGLPGGGYGVTPDGSIGFDGALQMNIPVGYTPGFGNFSVAGSVAAINGGFPDDFSGANNNGTLAFGLGLFREHTVWFSDMGTGAARSLESAYHVQAQVLRETPKRPGISVGVVDFSNLRLANEARRGETGGRSFFVVATREAGTPEYPLYLTLGFGTGRFNDHPFGGVSYRPLKRVAVFGEYDGFNPNVGAAYDLVSRGEWHAVVSLGLVDLERVNVGLALTKTDF